MDQHLLVHILEKVDKIGESVGHVRESQIRMEADVAEHIRRTALLEEHVKSVHWLKILSDSFMSLLRFLKLIK